MDWSRARREAIRQLADVRRRLAAAEEALNGARTELNEADTRLGAAHDRVAEAEHALGTAEAEQDQARRERYTARRAHERASTLVGRLRRRETDLSGRLDRMPPLGRADEPSFTGSCEPHACLLRPV